MLSTLSTVTGLVPFHFEGRQVRVSLDDDGTAWFVAQDACEVLDIRTDQTRRLDADEKGLRSIQTPSGAQQMVVVNEPGLYALVFGSRKPEAKAFKRWIGHEVLPTIRKTGSYSMTTPSAEMPVVPQSFADALRLAADQQDVIATQAEQLAAAAPAVEFVERYADSTGTKGFRQVAKLLNAKENEFREFLLDAKILYRLAGELTPHAQHIDAGRFCVKAGTAQVSGHAYNATRFTTKGVTWIAGEWAKHQVALRQRTGAEVAA